MAIVNADFSLNSGTSPSSPDGWTVVPASADSEYYFGRSGGNSAFSFGAYATSDDTILQSICVDSGCSYTVSYYLRNSRDAHFFPAVDGAVLQDSAGASLEIDSTNPSLTHTTDNQTPFTGYFTATSTSVVLSFAGRLLLPAYLDLQDIQIRVA